MAGHNKWSKIKHKKGVQDAKRSKIWTKIIREITVAVRLHGDDPAANPRLRKAMDDARSANMPKDNIERAVKKASGQDSENVEELVYEGYGPGGVAIVIECMTDNRNRTLSDVRTIIQKRGGNLGASGSVLFGFHKKGVFYFKKSLEEDKINEDMLLEVGLEYGIEEINQDQEFYIVKCEPDSYFDLKEAYKKASLEPDSSELTLIPVNTVKVSGDNLKKLISIIDALDDHDDVQNVYSNSDIDEKELEALG